MTESVFLDVVDLKWRVFDRCVDDVYRHTAASIWLDRKPIRDAVVWWGAHDLGRVIAAELSDD